MRIRTFAFIISCSVLAACTTPTPSPRDGATATGAIGGHGATDTLDFQPSMLLVRSASGQVAMYVMATAPDICFERGRPPVTIGPPSGIVVTPETHALQLTVQRSSRVRCASMRWPVTFAHSGLEATGHTTVTAWVVVANSVAGSTSLPISAAVPEADLTPSQRAALGKF